MLSRVAERMYWLGRYIERAENTARLVNVYSNVMLDLSQVTKFLWRELTDIIDSTEDFLKLYEKSEERYVIKFMLADERNPGSLVNSIRMARENARTTREILPSEIWELVTEMHLYATEHMSEGLRRSGRYEFLDGIIDYCHHFTGLIVSTLSETDAHNFIRIGVNLERADMTTRILDVGSATLLQPSDELSEAFQNALWMNVLRSLSAYQMYRQHVLDRVNAEDVVSFLLKDRKFPRAVARCLAELDECFRTLPHNDNPLRSVAHVNRVIADLDVVRVLEKSLHAFIDTLQMDLAGVHTEVESAWFRVQEPAAAEPSARTQSQAG